MSMTARIRDLAGDERGALTLEFTVLVPFFVFMLVIFADASLVYLTHSEMYNAARDVVRRMATEEITTDAEARDYAAAQLHLGGRVYQLSTEFGGEMRIRISVPLGDAAFFGYFFSPVLGDRHLTADAAMRREPLL